ncbi:MAG: hypothetical protein FK734_11330, partial [Asgard group archaeon]|nr:hypothetical protein [Asgard group archaeon]
MLKLTLNLQGSHKSEIPLVLPEDYNSDDQGALTLSDTAKNNTISKLHNFLVQLAESNRTDNCFWYTPVSEMQPFMSSIYQASEIRAAIDEFHFLDAKNYVYANSNYLMFGFLKQSLKKHKNLLIPFIDRILFCYKRVKYYFFRYINILFWLFEHLYHLFKTKELNFIPTSLDFLLISRYEKDLENQLDLNYWDDRFLGSLPELLAKNHKVAIFGRCGGDPAALSNSLNNFCKFPVWTIYQFISIWDLFKIVIRSLKFNLSINNVLDKYLADLAYSESRNHCRAIADCLLVEYALGRLLNLVQVKKIITM